MIGLVIREIYFEVEAIKNKCSLSVDFSAYKFYYVTNLKVCGYDGNKQQNTTFRERMTSAEIILMYRFCEYYS